MHLIDCLGEARPSVSKFDWISNSALLRLNSEVPIELPDLVVDASSSPSHITVVSNMHYFSQSRLDYILSHHGVLPQHSDPSSFSR